MQSGEPTNGQEFLRCYVCGGTDQQVGADRSASLAAMNATMASHLAAHNILDRTNALLALTLSLGGIVRVGVRL